MRLGQIFNDLFTGPDGKTVAIGRVMGVFMFLSGQATPFVALVQQQHIDFSALGVFEGALAAGVTALIYGTNPTEPRASGDQPKTTS
jgi:hypothetical protein